MPVTIVSLFPFWSHFSLLLLFLKTSNCLFFLFGHYDKVTECRQEIIKARKNVCVLLDSHESMDKYIAPKEIVKKSVRIKKPKKTKDIVDLIKPSLKTQEQLAY